MDTNKRDHKSAEADWYNFLAKESPKVPRFEGEKWMSANGEVIPKMPKVNSVTISDLNDVERKALIAASFRVRIDLGEKISYADHIKESLGNNKSIDLLSKNITADDFKKPALVEFMKINNKYFENKARNDLFQGDSDRYDMK